MNLTADTFWLHFIEIENDSSFNFIGALYNVATNVAFRGSVKGLHGETSLKRVFISAFSALRNVLLTNEVVKN